MNRAVFALRNIKDKLRKAARDPRIIGSYAGAFLAPAIRRRRPDIYVVSYPKCGRTWVRITLEKYLELSGHARSGKGGLSYTMPGGRVLLFSHDIGDWVPAPLAADKMRFDASRYAGRKVYRVRTIAAISAFVG